MPDPTRDDGRLWAACLCARWCNLCESYRATFEEAARELALPALWIDIEDEAALVHAVDVENFPTLLIARGERLLFLGTITPQPGTLRRLLQSAADGDLAPSVDGLAPADVPELMQALHARVRQTAPRHEAAE